MRNALHILILTLIIQFTTVRSQNISLSEDTISVNAGISEYDVVAHSLVTNNTGRTLSLRWYRAVNNIPASWTSAVCDVNQCWAPSVDGEEFNLAPGQSGTLDVHFYPNNQPGDGYIEVIVYDPLDSAATVVKGVYIARVSQNTSAPLPSIRNEIKIYPNPVDDYMLVKNVKTLDMKRVEIFNILGSKVLSFQIDPVNELNRFDVSDLRKGVYMVRIYDGHNNVLMTKTISKR